MRKEKERVKFENNMSSFGYIKSSNQPSFAFGQYVDEVLELAADVFGPAYRYVFAPYWNTSYEARIRQHYANVFWNECVYEVYLPVAAHMEMNMRYYRIVIKVVPEISQTQAKELAVELSKPIVKPNGIVDSETIFIVAPRRKGWTHGFKHLPLKGHQTCILINKNPYEIFKLLKRLIWRFLESRLNALLRKFNLQADCQANEIWYKKKGSFYYIYYYNNRRTRFRLYRHIIQTIKCLSRFLDWLKQKAKHFKTVNQLYEKIKQIKTLQAKREVINRLWRKTVSSYNNYQTVKALKFLQLVQTFKGSGSHG